MDIEPAELKQKLDRKEDFILIDVREVYENEEFNLGGQLIPLGELMTSADQISEDKDAEIVVYCRSGNRSGMAKMLLQQMRYTQVRNLLGGVQAWQAQGS